MIKKSLVLGMIAVLTASFIFTACEGPTGPTGAAGANGTNGTGGTGPQGPTGPAGYASATTLLAAQALFDAGVDKVYLSASDTTSTNVLTIKAGQTLLVPVTAALGSSGGIKVETGGTLSIKGAATIGGPIEVDGTLTVFNGASLTATTGKELTVNSGASVTIESGATLIASASIGDDDTDGVIVAKEIGKLIKTEGGNATDSLAAGGSVIIEDNAWLNLLAADAVDTIGFAAHKRLIASDAVTTSAFPGSGTGYVLKVAATSNALAIADVPAGDELILAAAGNALNATMTVAGTLTLESTAVLASAGAGKELVIEGTATVGDAVISGAGTGAAVETGTAAITLTNTAGRGSITFASGSILTVASGASVVVGGADGISLGTGAYGATGGQTSVITGEADGGATLTIGSTASNFLVGPDTTDGGELIVGAKSAVNLAHANSTLFTGNTSDNSAVVSFIAGSKLGVAGTYGSGITLADGKGGTADGSTILPAAADIDTDDTFKVSFKIKSDGSSAEWVAF